MVRASDVPRRARRRISGRAILITVGVLFLLVVVRLVLLERRHRGALQLADDLLPSLSVLDERVGGREGLEVQVLLVLLGAVAAVAVLGEKRFEDRLETGFGGLRDSAGGRGRCRCGGDRGGKVRNRTYVVSGSLGLDEYRQRQHQNDDQIQSDAFRHR